MAECLKLAEPSDLTVPTEETLRSCLNHPDYTGWFLKKREKKIGYILFNIAFEEAHLMSVVIGSPYRHQGYAGFLLRGSIEQLNTFHLKRLILEVRVDNLPAIRLYERAGFRQIGKRKNYYHHHGVSYDAWVYARDLYERD